MAMTLGKRFTTQTQNRQQLLVFFFKLESNQKISETFDR